MKLFGKGSSKLIDYLDLHLEEIMVCLTVFVHIVLKNSFDIKIISQCSSVILYGCIIGNDSRNETIKIVKTDDLRLLYH